MFPPPRAFPAVAAISVRPGGGSQAGGDTSVTSKYRGAQGLDPEFVKDLEKQFGFDKPPLERFLGMLWDYARFGLRRQLFP